MPKEIFSEVKMIFMFLCLETYVSRSGALRFR